ncbi:MAG: hypothetical protein US50_C0071G0004 [Candidatus Nomurabacteria bacterium GW2011_GWB1_37_5]|uniref:Uncharacterized protein n=1 Tax=Candidatus Nomurabacteria bacterium GW2011_GWB1_37_5 TaxID=1618742 RepID=A0A0G0H5J7_9BACT|nr:MAG: hypothetical protein US50_C0071G0004 [Candidatus Nomurabacteria bacterium GW2011_GWB1_37_5]
MKNLFSRLIKELGAKIISDDTAKLKFKEKEYTLLLTNDVQIHAKELGQDQLVILVLDHNPDPSEISYLMRGKDRIMGQLSQCGSAMFAKASEKELIVKIWISLKKVKTTRLN